MKNILVISQNFWPEKFLVNEFCDELKKKNYKITILTGKSGYYLSNSELKKKRKSCKKYKFHQAFTLDRGNSYIRLIFNYLSFVISGIILIFFNSYKKKFDYVIVYATSPMTQVIVGYFAKIIFNAKFIIWVQDLWPNILESFFYKKTKFIKYFLEKFFIFFLKKADLILCQSEGYVNHYKKLIKNNRIVFFPNFSSEIKLKKKKIFCKNVFFYAGNIGKFQNLNLIINAAKIFEKKRERILFKVYGNGSEKNLLKQRVKHENLSNISYCGYVSQREISKLLIQEAKGALLTLNDNYGLNLTIPSRLQMFLSLGVPVVGSINGEAKKIIKKSKSGFCVEANNLKGFVKIISILSKIKKTKYKQLSLNGKNYYKQNFSKKKIMNIWEREIKKL